jgi:ribosomal-protein-alanine N-acetyltransferase
MTLEPVMPDQSEALAACHAQAFAKPWDAAEIAAVLGGPGSFGLAAWNGDAIAGFILARAIAGEAEVLTLAICEAGRRQGLARALLAAATDVSRTSGAQSMFLEVAADNVAAIALYSGAGFVQVGVRPGYYRSAVGPFDALVMRRDLNTEAG